MKILIPTNSEKSEEGICPSFGRAPYFMIWNTESGQGEYKKNPGAESTSGAGIKAAQTVVDIIPDVVIAPRMGKNSADVITAKSMKIYKSISENINETINNFMEGKLDELTDIHPGFHQH